MKIRILILGVSLLSLTACYEYAGMGPFLDPWDPNRVHIESQALAHCTAVNGLNQHWTKRAQHSVNACNHAMHACRMGSNVRWSSTCQIMR